MPLILKIWIALIIVIIVLLAMKRKTNPIEEGDLISEPDGSEYWDDIKLVPKSQKHTEPKIREVISL